MGETRGKQGETRLTVAEKAKNCATVKRPCIRSKLKAIRCRSTRLTIVSPCFPHVSPSFPPHCKIRFVKNLLYFATNVWVFCVEMHINIPKLCQPSAPLSRTINALFGLFPPGGGNWVSSPEYKSPRCLYRKTICVRHPARLSTYPLLYFFFTCNALNKAT